MEYLIIDLKLYNEHYVISMTHRSFLHLCFVCNFIQSGVSLNCTLTIEVGNVYQLGWKCIPIRLEMYTN